MSWDIFQLRMSPRCRETWQLAAMDSAIIGDRHGRSYGYAAWWRQHLGREDLAQSRQGTAEVWANGSYFRQASE